MQRPPQLCVFVPPTPSCSPPSWVAPSPSPSLLSSPLSSSPSPLSLAHRYATFLVGQLTTLSSPSPSHYHRHYHHHHPQPDHYHHNPLVTAFLITVFSIKWQLACEEENWCDKISTGPLSPSPTSPLHQQRLPRGMKMLWDGAGGGGAGGLWSSNGRGRGAPWSNIEIKECIWHIPKVFPRPTCKEKRHLKKRALAWLLLILISICHWSWFGL